MRKIIDIFTSYWPEHADVRPGINDNMMYVMSNTLEKSDWKNTTFLMSLGDIKKFKDSDCSALHVW